MKTELTILFNDKLKRPKIMNVYISLEKNLKISMLMPKSVPISQMFQNSRKMLDNFLKNSELHDAIMSDSDKRKLSSVIFRASNKDIYEYLKLDNNKNALSNYKIIIDNEDNYFDLFTKRELKKYFGKETNILVNMPDNIKEVHIDDLFITIDFLHGIANKIRKLKLSPLEELMYAYDIVRDREYKIPENTSLFYQSDDLNHVVLGDKIICAGFSNLYYEIIYALGYDTIRDHLDSSDIKKQPFGHVRNALYIKDEKYNVDGIYEVDATWDSRIDNDLFLYRYKYFANTIQQFSKKDKSLYIKSITFPNMNKNLTNVFMMEVLENIDKLKNKKNNEIVPICSEDTFATIYHADLLLNGDENEELLKYNELKKSTDVDKIIQITEQITSVFNKPLTANQLIPAFYNVRLKENFSDDIKFPIDKDVFYSVLMNSDWHYEFDGVDKEIIDALDLDLTDEQISKNDKVKLTEFLMEKEIIPSPFYKVRLIEVENNDQVNKVKVKEKKNKK